MRVGKTYPDCRITCMECSSGGELLNLNLLDGGYGCNYAVARVRLGLLGGSCRVYGQKLTPAESAAQACKQWAENDVLMF